MTAIATASPEIGAIFGGSPEAKTIPFGMSSMSILCSFRLNTSWLTRLGSTHTFEVGEGPYKELENYTWVGNARFVVSDEGVALETRVSKLVPSTSMD